MKKLIVLALVVMLLVSAFPASASPLFACTPGYWKNHTAWTSFIPGPVGAVFSAAPAPFASDSLVVALDYGRGGGVEGATRILLRVAVAAYINEYVGTYPYASLGDLQVAVNAALASGDRGTMLGLATMLDDWNNGMNLPDGWWVAYCGAWFPNDNAPS